MKRFVYRLDRLLSLRRHKEEEWERNLAVATGKVVGTQREIEERVKQKAGALVGQYRGGAEVLHLLATNAYMRRLDQEIEHRQHLLVQYQLEREKVTERYLLASRDRKILDRLKEKRAAEYRKEQRIEEVKELDDITSGRAGLVRDFGSGLTVQED